MMNQSKLCTKTSGFILLKIGMNIVLISLDVVYVATNTVFQCGIQPNIQGCLVRKIDKQLRIERIAIELWNCC